MIDAHFHNWQLARGDYGRLTPALAPIHRDVRVGAWWGAARQWVKAGDRATVFEGTARRVYGV